MLDYYEHTLDEAFLAERTGPDGARRAAILRHALPARRGGQARHQPTQAVETYWYDVVNDTPSGGRPARGHRAAAGAARLERRRRPSASSGSGCTRPLRRCRCRRRRQRPGDARREVQPEAATCENLELYAIWPFRLFGVGRPDLDLAVDTFRRRPEKASIGWQYDGQMRGGVGLADEARGALVGKVGNSNPRHRFPAMWGPNYDWLPDQDHGSNIMLTLQPMLHPAGRRQDLPAARLAEGLERALQAARARPDGRRGRGAERRTRRPPGDARRAQAGCHRLGEVAPATAPRR